jgi:hypothetical protein
VLTGFYMMNHPYANPRLISRRLSDFTSELEFWYQSLPISLQFPRSVIAYTTLRRPMPAYKVSMRTIMYFGACIF